MLKIFQTPIQNGNNYSSIEHRNADPLKIHIIFIFIIIIIIIITIIFFFLFFLLLFFVINIIINRHALGHDRPVWASSESLFQGIPSYGLQFGIVLASSCFSCLLHVVGNLSRVVSASRQLVTFSSSKFLHSFCAKRVRMTLFFWKISCRLLLIIFYPLAWGSKFRFHVEVWGEPMLQILLFSKDFWVKFGLKVLFKLPNICANSVSV